MQELRILALLCLLLTLANSNVKGLDMSFLSPASRFQCFKEQGNQFVIVGGLTPFGEFNVNVSQNLENARAAGLKTDMYLFTCG